jgi:hypothetical protein
MSRVHGSNTVLLVDGNDLTAFTSDSEIDRKADFHDVTPYGATAHIKDGGLEDGSGTMSGTFYDDATGPRAVLEPLTGTKVTLVRRPAGTGTGKPQDSVDVVITGYKETAPSAGMISWVATFELADAVDATAQA